MAIFWCGFPLNRVTGGFFSSVVYHLNPLIAKFISWKPPIPAYFPLPHSTRLPDAPCPPHGGETSQLSSTRASSAAEVTNDLGELPWRLEGREYCEGMPDSPARSSSKWGYQKSPTLQVTGDACNRAFKRWNKLPGSHQRRFGGHLMLRIWLVPPSIPRMHLIDERAEQEIKPGGRINSIS